MHSARSFVRVSDRIFAPVRRSSRSGQRASSEDGLEVAIIRPTLEVPPTDNLRPFWPYGSFLLLGREDSTRDPHIFSITVPNRLDAVALRAATHSRRLDLQSAFDIYASLRCQSVSRESESPIRASHRNTLVADPLLPSPESPSFHRVDSPKLHGALLLSVQSNLRLV